jgi:hypothetical protein
MRKEKQLIAVCILILIILISIIILCSIWENCEHIQISTDEQKQIKFTKTLFDMDDFLTSHGIHYRLSCGTMLAAYRENRFISYDLDIDLEILINDYNPSIEKGNKNFERHRSYGNPVSGYELTFKHRETGINVDLFFLYDEKDYRWYASYNGKCDLGKNKMCRWKIPKVGATTISFVGRDFPIHEDPEGYVSSQYGPNWNIPRNYNYIEGLTSNIYSLIQDDFPVKDRIIIKNIKQKFNIWPRKIMEMTKPLLWVYLQNKSKDRKKPSYPDLNLQSIYKKHGKLFEIIVLDDDVIPVVSRTVNSNFKDINPIEMREKYISSCILQEYGGTWFYSNS